MYKANQTTSYSDRRETLWDKVQLRNTRALSTIFAKTFLTLVAVLLLAPFNFTAPAFGQTEPPPPNMNNGPGDPGAGALSPGAQTTDPTARQFPDEPPTNLVIQAAEQNKDTVITEVDELLTDNFRAYNETYQGLHTFWGDDIISNLFANIGQLIGKWLTEFINGWVSDTVQFLTGFLRVFVLNPNIAINGLNGNAADDISPYIRQAADVMYGIAVDLLLLLFILCIWKFWAEAAWRGGGNLMGAVGRLIFTSGLMLAWPTIYAFEIQITNEMIRTLYFNSADQVSALDAAMAAAVKGGLLAGAGLIANATAPIAGQAFGGILGAGPGGLVLGTVGSLVAFVGLIIYLVLGGILIAQLVYILVLKAIQTALLTAQYMFAPIFLVFFATPDTENVTSGFVRSFVEVSLWTFVWVGMLKIMVIMILSDFNPWGKIILAVGILQLMIQVPAFLARAQISPMSDFISAGLITGGLMKAGHALSDTLGKRGMQLAKSIGGDFTTGAARGGEMSKKVGLDGLAHGVRDPKLLKEMRQAQKGEHPSQLGKNLKPGDKDGKGGDGKTPLGPDGKPIKPAGGPGAAMPGQPPKGKDKDKKAGADAINPAAAAAAAGKGLNTGEKKPGEAGGLDAGSAGKTAADALKKGLVGAGVAGGVGAGLAAMQGARQGIGGNGAGGSDEESKRAREAAEQAGMEAKNLANQINNGSLEDKDKNEPPTKAKLVEGKELKTGGADGTGKPGDKQAKIGLPGSGADLSSALGAKGGADANKVDPTKGAAGANASKDITQPVDRNLKPAGAGDKKEAGPTSKGMVTDAKDLGAGGKDGKLDNGTGVPVGEDGRPLSMDVEDESANKVGLGLPPGVKLTPGAVTGGGDKDKNVQPPAKGAEPKDLATGKTGGKDGATAAGAGPVLVGLKKPGAINQTPSTKNSSDPVVAGLATATSVPTTGKNIDPTTALGDETATDEKGLVPEGTNLPKPLKTGGADKGAADKGALTADGSGKDVTAGAGGGGKQQPPVKTPGPQTVQIEKSEKGGVNLVLPGVAVAATQKGIAGAGAGGEQRIDSKTGDVVDASGQGQGQGLQQPTELKSTGAAVPPGKLDTASGANQADLKTDVTASGQGAVKGPQGTATQNVQVDSVGTTTPGVSVGLNLPGAKAIVPGAKVGDGLKLDAKAPGGEPSVSPTGLDQNQQTELKPGAGAVTGKVDTGAPGANQAELKTEVSGGQGAALKGGQGTVTQSVQVDSVGTTTPGVAVGLNLPGAKAILPGAKVGDGLKLDARTPGGEPSVSPTGQDQNQQTELKPGTGAVTGKVDTGAPGANQAELKTEVSGGQGAAAKGGQGTVTQNVQVDSVGTTTPGVAIGLNLPGAKAIIPGAKIGDGLKLDARTPGGDPSVSPTGQDQNQQTELKPGAGAVTGKIDTGAPGTNQAELKTEVTGGQTLKPPGSTGSVTQNVQVDSATTGGAQAPLNMPGARVNAKTNVQGQLLNASGGQVDAEAEGVVTGNLNAPNVQGILGKTQLDVGSVRPDGTAQVGTQATGRVDVQQTTKPVQAAASATPLQAVATAGLRTRAAAVPGMQKMFDDGDDGGGESGGGGGTGGGGGGGGRPGPPWQPPDDRPPHGVAPASPFENRLNATGAARPIDNYQQAFYRWIPPRGISGAIRLAQGVTLGPSGHGGAELIGDAKGNTMHVRTGEGMDQDQMALQMMTAGYATLLGSDPHAYDAARAAAISAGEDKPKGWAQRMAAGIFAYNGGSWSQTANAKNNFQRSMYQHAVEGSQAYVNGQPGNEYTEYLSQRYGTMSDKQQAFGVHLMTDPSSPESSWHWAHVPATETLVKNSIPINAVSRAVAANPNVFRARPWEQRAAITGGIQYMEARKAQEVPDVEPMVADAWVGREAQLLAPAVINTITSLTSELGEDACWDVAKVNNVASTVGAGRDQSEYVSAYRALANVEERVKSFGSRTSSPPSPPTSGGGTGVVSGPGGGGGGFGGGFGGGAVTSVSGRIIGGGGGGSAGGAATVDQVVEVEPGQQGAGSVPPPNLSGLTPPINPAGGPQVQTNIVWQAKPGFTPGQTVQGNGPIRMTANTPPAQLGQHVINQSSGNLSAPPMQPITNNQVVEVEVVGTRMQNVPRVDQSQIKVPDVNAPTQDVRTNVDFQVNGGRDSGGLSGGTDRISVDATTNGTRVTSSSVSIGNAPTASASNDVTRNVRGEIQHRRSEYGSLNPDHLNSNVANLVNQFKDPAEAAFHIVYDLHAAGFSFDQIADDKIATTAIAVRAQDPSMMRTAAIAANALGADNFTVERTHVVQAMMDSDPRWSEHNIDDKSIYGAEAIVRVHDNYQQEMTSSDPGHPMGGIRAYPTKDFVDRVVMHPEFKPRAQSPGSGYNESVVNKIVERFKDRIAGRDPNYGGIYDNRGSGQPA